MALDDGEHLNCWVMKHMAGAARASRLHHSLHCVHVEESAEGSEGGSQIASKVSGELRQVNAQDSEAPGRER